MKKIIINVSARKEGSVDFFVLEDSSNHPITEVPTYQVPSALGEKGVQFDSELELALAKLAELPAPHSGYQFVLSDDACILRDKVFEISELIFGDEVSAEAWNKAMEQK